MINSNLDIWRPVSSCNQICLKKGSCLLRSNKLSELKTVSLSRIARENLVNYDDATIYHNDKNPGTVNSRYSGHPRDRNLVSIIARVCNSGVRETFNLNHIYRMGSHACSFSLTPVPFSDPLSQVKSVRLYLQTEVTHPLCTVVLLST